MIFSSMQIAVVVLVVVFCGALIGILLNRRLPEQHLSTETRTSVSVAMAVVGTMTALVIGLLISSASTSFNARNADVSRLSMDIVRLDGLLRRYGPEADGVRKTLKDYATLKVQDLFPAAAGQPSKVDDPASGKLLDGLEDRVLAFNPGDERQRWLQAQVLQVSAEISETRALLVEQNLSSLPLPFLGAVVIWFSVLFVSFGMFAPRNITVVVALFVCALAVSMAFKLILDLDTPFEGGIRFTPPPIRLSSEPLRRALQSIAE